MKLYCIIALSLLLRPETAAAQQEELMTLSLQQAIEIAQENSPEAQAARHTYRAAYWNYRFFRANYLPSVTLTSSPTLNREINKITQPDGTNQFIQQDQLSTDLSLKINQNIWFTGGSLFVKSTTQRIDEFEDNHTAYNTQPVVIGYEQQLFGYNSLKWDRRIEPLRYREARKAYAEALELVASETSTLFFNLATAQTNLDIATYNYASADTLYRYAEGRYNIGTITENEMLQLEINKLTEETNMMNARIEVEDQMQTLRSFLGINREINLRVVPENSIPQFEISLQKALQLAFKNSPDPDTYKRKQLESRSALASAKANAGLKADLYVQFGLSQTGNKFADSYLLGIQFFICWIFVAFTVALYMQAEKTESTLFNTLTEKEKANILSFSIDYMFMKNEEKLALIERISKFSGVQDKLLADISYLKGISGTGMQMEKGNPESSFEVNVMNVSTNFFQFMNIPLLSGHTLKAKEDLVVDKTWAERQKKDPLGTILYNYSESYTICGICGDFIANVYNQSPGFVFLPSDFNYYVGHCYLKCEPGKTAEIKKMIEKTLQETLPESIHPQVTTLQEDIYEAQATENKLKGIILFFSIVSLLITLLGVYSTITLDTERRQKEVAIRKVNGAGLKQIILLFARLYIRLLTVSAVIAFPFIYIVIQMWKKAYIVFFNDGIIYWAGIFIGITFITALTVLFRILRIARINPAEVIKNE